MKKLSAAILAAVILLLLSSACGVGEFKETTEPVQAVEDGPFHTLYFKDSAKSDTAVVTFFNSASGESEDVEMVTVGEDESAVTFSCQGNTELYNAAYITYGDKKTKEFAFNPCVSGWYNSADGFLPYTEGLEIDYSPSFDEITLDCSGYEKEIHIWKPDDYDADSKEKYAAIYVLDGQHMAFVGKSGQLIEECEFVTEQVRAMISVTGKKAIVIAVDTYGNMSDVNRYDELIPDLSAFGAEIDEGYSKMKGTEFSDFVCDTLVPYVQQRYNVYTDALHTAIAGVSLSGLESFYITMEHPDIFGAVGALSPSFLYIEGGVWDRYLSPKNFDESSPFLFFYTGPEGGDTDPDVTQMAERLKDMGYPEDKIALHFNENGTHTTDCWRNVFSGFLTAMMFQRIEPLQR